MPLRKNEVITVGLAMSAWGEFAYITATTARREGLMDEHTFSAVVLAVMMSVVLSPTLLRLHLSRSSKTASCRALFCPFAPLPLCTPSTRLMPSAHPPRTPHPAPRTLLRRPSRGSSTPSSSSR